MPRSSPIPARLALAAAFALGAGAIVLGAAQLGGAVPREAVVAAAIPAEAEPCPSGSQACALHGAHGDGPGAAGLATGSPKLLEFEAAYCSACATMAPVVQSIVASCAKGSDVVRRVDVVAREGEALARHYEVAALPTFVAVDAEGREVFRKVGVQKPDELASLVAEVTGRDCVSNN